MNVKLVEGIDTYINSVQTKVTRSFHDPDNININDFTEAKDTLDDFLKTIRELEDRITKAKTVYQACKRINNSYNELIFKCVQHKRDPAYKSWNSIITETAPVICRDIFSHQNISNEEEIKINKKYSIPAIKITDGDIVKMPYNKLLYKSSTNEFILKLPTITLYGNIGRIYNDDQELHNTKICTYQANCINRVQCKFWHNPSLVNGSTDIMNFTTKSWIYDPVRPNRRHYGSLENLESDIARLTNDDYIYFVRQTMHDLLCCIILGRYFKGI